MTKKMTWTACALVAVFALTAAAMGYSNIATACDKSAKSTSATTCSKSAAAKSASAKACCKSSAAKTASAACKRGAAASTCIEASKANCQGAENAKAGKCKARTMARAEAAKTAAALSSVVDEIPYGESRRIVVSGSMECSRCTYDATARCQPLLKTVDGKVYPLVQNGMVKRMHDVKTGQFEVTSRVKKMNGVKYLDVKTFKSL